MAVSISRQTRFLVALGKLLSKYGVSINELEHYGQEEEYLGSDYSLSGKEISVPIGSLENEIGKAIASNEMS